MGSSQRELQRSDHSRPSKVVFPPLAGRHSRPASALPASIFRVLPAAVNLVSGEGCKGALSVALRHPKTLPRFGDDRRPDNLGWTTDDVSSSSSSSNSSSHSNSISSINRASASRRREGVVVPRHVQSPNAGYRHLQRT